MVGLFILDGPEACSYCQPISVLALKNMLKGLLALKFCERG